MTPAVQSRMPLVPFLLSALFFAQSTLGAPEIPARVTRHGPNCWNTALVYSGVLEHIRFMSARELNEVMLSGVCEAVPDYQARPGDFRLFVLPIEDLSVDSYYVHANLRMDGEWSLNKMTNLLTSTIQLERDSKVQDTYGRFAEIVTLRDKSGRAFYCSGDQCKTKIIYYRCKSLEDKLRAADPKLYAHFNETTKAIQDYVFLSPSATGDEVEISIRKAKLAADTFEEKLASTCQSTAFPCTYYREARASFSSQLQSHQPSKDWLQNYFLGTE